LYSCFNGSALAGSPPPSNHGSGQEGKVRGGRAKKPSGLRGKTGLREFQTLSVSTSFRRGWRMVRAGGGAGRPADMSKSLECRTDVGRFWLRRGIGFAGLKGRKDCAMPGMETGESKSRE
jgi:hypothetical protein